MKKMTTILGLMLMSSSVFSSVAFAQEVVKTCSIQIKVRGDSLVMPATLRIIRNGDNLIAKTTRTVNGIASELPVVSATIAEFSVRENLRSGTPNMNLAEQLIQGTEDIVNRTDYPNAFSVGVDLKAIRHAKVYQIGRITEMGGLAILEAQDQSGKEIGSFVTGFLPFACE